MCGLGLFVLCFVHAGAKPDTGCGGQGLSNIVYVEHERFCAV